MKNKDIIKEFVKMAEAENMFPLGLIMGGNKKLNNKNYWQAKVLFIDIVKSNKEVEYLVAGFFKQWLKDNGY